MGKKTFWTDEKIIAEAQKYNSKKALIEECVAYMENGYKRYKKENHESNM